MKNLLLCLFLVCASAVNAQDYFVARVTYYANDAIYGNKTASGEIAKKGVTVAAAKNFKFGTKFSIPELSKVFGDSEFEVQDRGPAVCRRTASGGKTPVIDVYVGSVSEINRLKKTMPMYMKVYIQ